MTLLTIRVLLACTIALCVPVAVASDQDYDYETIRFYTKNSKPEQIGAHALSPNGRYLALSFRSNLGSKSGVSIVDLEKKELIKQTGSFSYFTLAFSGDSRKVLGIGGYAGTQLIDVQSGSIQKVTNAPNVFGKIGISLDVKNGKLLITHVVSEFNPTIGDQIQVGDELLAVNEGEKPTRYDDRQGWKPLAGKTLKKALEMLAGRPGTWVQLRLVRRGQSDPIDVSVQRQWPSNHRRRMPTRGESLALSEAKGAYQFCSADTGAECAFISLRDIEQAGQSAISPDATRFAWLSKVVGRGDFCVEVHSLVSGELERSAILTVRNYRDMKFSPDSQKVLVGTRDTVEVFDISSDSWQEPVALTAPEDVDSGRVVTRKIPLGLGIAGDLYTTSRDVVYSKPAALSEFDISPSGTMAIGSESGELFLASLESRERIAVVGDNILGERPEVVEFSPDGRHLVAFAKGVLHVFEIGESNANSEIMTDSEATGSDLP